MIGYTRLFLAAAFLLGTVSSGFAQTANMAPQLGAKLQDVEAIITEFIDDLSAQNLKKPPAP